MDNGQPRLRAECPRPDYTGNLDLDFSKEGISSSGGVGRYNGRCNTGTKWCKNTWRIDESPGLQEKWLVIAEIDVSQ